MEIYKYEGSVFIRRWEFRAKRRMTCCDGTYSYRYTDVKPLLQHIKR